MRIITLKAENVKRLRAIEVSPEGDVVVIAGRNAQGKSSVLDAIWMALAGAAGAKETTRPIRDGEKQASVELNLGDLIVTRKWTEGGTSLIVAAQDGARYSSPQTILDGLIGRLSFDPLEFAEQDSKAQLRTLLDVVDLPFDPAHLDAQRKGVYDQRTELNREVKRLETLLADMEPVPEDTPDEEVSAVALAAELEKAQTFNRLREDLVRLMTENQERLAELQAELEEREERGRALARQIEDPLDTEPLREQLRSAEQTNANVRAKHERKHVAKEWSKTKEYASVLTARLETIDASKADAIANAKMPLEGLSFDEEGVLYNGVPFSQVSDSERLRVSIAIAMALNPKIRIIRITDGSLLDSENMKLIAEMARENDYQCWIERVADAKAGSVVYIEDGSVVE